MAGAAINEQEASRRRRVIQHALSSIFSTAELHRAIEIWEAEFHDSPTFVVSSFAGRLRQELELGERSQTVSRMLMKSLFLKADELGPDPLSQGMGGPPAAPSPGPQAAAPPAVADDATVVFGHLLSTLVRFLGSPGSAVPEQFRLHLQSQTEGLGLGQKARTVLDQWTASADAMFTTSVGMGLSVDDMSNVLHVVYLWICDVQGPVKADRLLANCARQCDALPEGTRFRARSLF